MNTITINTFIIQWHTFFTLSKFCTVLLDRIKETGVVNSDAQ
uniref:Uncharacterized protein n=1 Tax=Anguilla anguilla TaxID=7936 RepID=A0A0E9XDL4_ANGAN